MQKFVQEGGISLQRVDLAEGEGHGSSQFEDPDTHEAILVQTYGNKARKVSVVGTDEAPGLNPITLKIDGAGLVQHSIEMGLRPGKQWAVGYHFRQNDGNH